MIPQALGRDQSRSRRWMRFNVCQSVAQNAILPYVTDARLNRD